MGIESGNQTVRQEASKGSFKVVDIKDVLDEVRSEGNINRKLILYLVSKMIITKL